MKNIVCILTFLSLIILGCNTSKSIIKDEGVTKKQNDTIRIANDSLEYEVIIIDPGFSSWLLSRAYPRGFHSLSYLETKNKTYINEWNNRVHQPQRYSPNLYGMSIDYNWNIDYGYEVNYLIYNYMIYFQNTFKQKLNGYVPIR